MRIKAEASSSMQLLRAILPAHVIRKLKQGKKYIAQYHEEVSDEEDLERRLLLRLSLCGGACGTCADVTRARIC